MAICLKKVEVIVSAESINVGKDERGISGEINLSDDIGNMGLI